MSRPGLFAACGAVPLAAAVWLAVPGAEEPPPRDPAAQLQAGIDRDVELLAADSRAERTAAEQRLSARGPVILDRLPAAEAVADPAARAALDRIRKKLVEEQAERSVDATPVCLRGRGPIRDCDGQTAGDRPRRLHDAFAFTPAQAERAIDVDAVGRGYWSVADEIGAQARLWPDAFDDRNRLTFRERTPEDDAKRVAYAYAFRVAAGPVSTKPIAGGDGKRLVRVPLEVRAEPKLRPLFLACAAKDFELAAGGRRIESFSPAAKYEVPFGENGDAAELRLDFVAPGDLPAGRAELSGRMRFTAAAAEEPFVLSMSRNRPGEPRASLGSPQTRGGVTVRFRDARFDDGAAEIELSVVYDRGGPAFESYRTWVYHNDAVVRYEADRDGERVEYRLDPQPDFATLAQSDGGVVLRYRFAGVPADAENVAFVYAAPTRILDLPVEIAIDDLPLPAAEAGGEVSGGSDAAR